MCMFALYTPITCAVFNHKQKAESNIKNCYIMMTYLLLELKAGHIVSTCGFRTDRQLYKAKLYNVKLWKDKVSIY